MGIHTLYIACSPANCFEGMKIHVFKTIEKGLLEYVALLEGITINLQYNNILVLAFFFADNVLLKLIF